MTQYSRRERYQFPEPYSLTSTDEKYFEMVYNETKWNRKQEDYDSKVKETYVKKSIRIDQHGAPDSNSLTEADREYFNIIKTEDGLSDFFKTKISPDHIFDRPGKGPFHIVTNDLTSPKDDDPNIKNHVPVRDNHPIFKYHIISLGKTNKSKKPILGLYLPHYN